MTDVPISRGDRLPTDARWFNKVREAVSRPPEWARTFNVKKYNPTTVKVQSSGPRAAWSVVMLDWPLKRQQGPISQADYVAWPEWRDEPVFVATPAAGELYLHGAAGYGVIPEPASSTSSDQVCKAVVSGIVPGYIIHGDFVENRLGEWLMPYGGAWISAYGGEGEINQPKYNSFVGRLVWIDSGQVPSGVSGSGESWGLIQIGVVPRTARQIANYGTKRLNSAWQKITGGVRFNYPSKWSATADINCLPNTLGLSNATRHKITISAVDYTIGYVTSKLVMEFRWVAVGPSGTDVGVIGTTTTVSWDEVFVPAAQSTSNATLYVPLSNKTVSTTVSTGEQPANTYAGIEANCPVTVYLEGRIASGAASDASVKVNFTVYDQIMKNRLFNGFTQAPQYFNAVGPVGGPVTGN